MKKKLLILNGSLSEATLIEKAKELGYFVITAGNAPWLMGHALADQYIEADYSNKELILEIVEKNNIDCIVSCANDFGVITASYVAEKMKWKGHDTYHNAVLLHQKDSFKSFIQKMGIRTPISTAFNKIDEAQKYIERVEYPIIVKAADLTGGKGIQKAKNYKEAIIAIENAFKKSRNKHIVIEPFIVGKQQSLLAFIKDKKVIESVSCDCFSPINPYLIQSELMPAENIENYKDELHSVIEKICAELNLVDGALTLQYIVKDGKPYIIELMRRCLGNQFFTIAREFSGFPWEEALIRAETGMELTDLKYLKKRAKYVGHHGIMASKNGIINGYSINNNLQKHIFKKIDILQKGERINDYLNERVAYIYYSFDNKEEAYNTVNDINSLIKIDIV